MSENYIPRSLEPVLAKAAAEFPVVVLIGPRQSGKTTLLQHLFGAQRPLISLEPPDVRAAAISDPRGFLDFYAPPVVYDEIQYAPEAHFSLGARSTKMGFAVVAATSVAGPA